MAEGRRWALVTGASSGIGAEIARVLAARGFALALTARRGDRLRELAGALGQPGGAAPAVFEADLEDPAAPERLIEAVRGQGIALHTLVNNAGFGLRGRFATLPYEGQVGMLELNVVALTKLCRFVLPDLIARRAGGIVNVASIAGTLAGPNMAVYYASKAYVISLSEALHEEARPHGVTVTAVLPGATATEFAARADLQMSKLFEGGAMSAAEVARLSVEGYLRGEAVVVTGAQNRLAALSTKLLPRALTRKLAGRLQK